MQQNKGTYLISKGIVDLLTNRYKLELSEKGRFRIRKLENEFVKNLGSIISDTYNYTVISPKEIKKAMGYARARTNGLPMICLDDVYFPNQNRFPVEGNIDVTRLVDDVKDFNKKSLGPRNGGASLEDQINGLSQYKGKDIALMDIGIFEGETLFKDHVGIANLLKKNEINPRKIYVSIMNEDSYAKLKDKIDIVAGKDYSFEGGDWLEVRDLLGLDGRKMNRENYPVPQGTYIFARYIENEKTLQDGASITGPKTKKVLDLCYSYNKKILDQIRNDGYTVTEGRLNNDEKLYTIRFDKKGD